VLELDPKDDNTQPWIGIAFKFAKLYDSNKKYILMADCKETQPDHPAVALYRLLTNPE